MNIEIHDPALEARLQKQLEATGSRSVEEALLRLLETQEEQDRWLAESRVAVDAQIRRGLEQLDRGEGISAPKSATSEPTSTYSSSRSNAKHATLSGAIIATETAPCPACNGSGVVPVFAALRERLGMTERELAEALGVHMRTITRWQTGRSRPHRLFLEKMESLVQDRHATDSKS